MTFQSRFEIAGRAVGEDCPAYLIAEIGRNHNGDLDLAKRAIDAAVEAGADAVKFQSFTARNLVRRDLGNVAHVAETGGGKSIFQLTQEAELSPDMHRALAKHAKARGIHFFSTPEDHDMVRLLAELDLPVYKIASLDIRYLDLIQAIAKLGKPVILSTGMSYLGEVETALGVLAQAGIDRVAVLHCVSNYPPKDTDINLRAMTTLREAFRVPVGFSDHSMHTAASVAAVALGATIIERHFTLDRNLPGTDHRISLEPAEFKAMVQDIRRVEAALGSPIKQPCGPEQEMRRLHRRRLVAARAIPAGKALERDDIACKCSEHGFEPDLLPSILGRKAAQALVEDAPLTSATVI